MTSKQPQIHYIPVELLIHIFCCFVRVGDIIVYGKSKLPPALILRSVCRRWHAVSEATPELWPDLVGPYGLGWAQRALILSKDLPLDLCIETRSDRYYRAVKKPSVALPLIMAERHRVEAMSISYDGSDYDAILQPQALLALPMPRLRKLKLRSASSMMEPLDENTFSGDMPSSLTDLEVSHYPILPSCTLLQAPLTCLKIYDCPCWESMSGLFDSLSRLSQLEIFDWDDGSLGESFGHVPLLHSREASYGSVQLSRLRSIKIKTSLENITHFFACVELPSSCSIVADADLINIPHGDLAPIYPALDLAFGERLGTIFQNGGPASGFQVLKIDRFDNDVDNGVVLNWSKPTLSHGPAQYHLGFRPNYDDDDGYIHPDTLTILCHILEHWPATRDAVSEVHNDHMGFFLEEDEYTDSEDSEDSEPTTPIPPGSETQPWSHLLRLLSSLERIYAHSDVDRLAEALALRFARNELLHLRNVDLHRTRLTSTEVTNLNNVLKARKCVTGEGVPPIPTLRLRDCHLDDVKVADLTVS